MHLSPHFSLSEFVDSPTANRLHINNTPNAQVISNLRLLCENILEPLRAHINETASLPARTYSDVLNIGLRRESAANATPVIRDHAISAPAPSLRGRAGGEATIIINSGYRCEALNRAVGGAWNSNHLYGYAADIHIDSIEEGRQWFEWIKQNCQFDELIWESTTHHLSPTTQYWIHVAYRHGKNRKKVISYLRK